MIVHNNIAEPHARDTIFALSSGPPPAAVAVVRISGPGARTALEALIGRVPEARRAVLARVRDPAAGEVLDSALSLWFPGPRSETGEDMAELQLHGGRAVVAGVLAALGRLNGLRLAEPGEFTRRAFENGRLDLPEVEGLADLIYAETEAQRRQAYRQLSGILSERAEHWRHRLIEALALVEARIDFADEGDVPAELIAPALVIARSLRDEIRTALADERRGERLREGLVVAIAGPPNAGKSSLLNRIAGREAAIVTPVPGTTRDVIEVHLNLDGYPVTVLDTAGIRETDDPVEREGVARARARAAGADLVLWVVDASRGAGGAEAPEGAGEGPVWTVLNKTDLVNSGTQRSLPRRPDVFSASALTGAGLDELFGALSQFVKETLSPGESALVTRQRQRAALQGTTAALERAIDHVDSGEELVAEELRLAGRSLGRLTGRVDVEDVLDVIFRDFCIGK
jgi:tRNA modification GTPase